MSPRTLSALFFPVFNDRSHGRWRVPSREHRRQSEMDGFTRQASDRVYRLARSQTKQAADLTHISSRFRKSGSVRSPPGAASFRVAWPGASLRLANSVRDSLKDSKSVGPMDFWDQRGSVPHNQSNRDILLDPIRFSLRHDIETNGLVSAEEKTVGKSDIAPGRSTHGGVNASRPCR